jgi:hypothetical protein
MIQTTTSLSTAPLPGMQPSSYRMIAFQRSSRNRFSETNLEELARVFRHAAIASSRALQKPLRLGHCHASMAAALALHGFAGAAPEHPQ